MSQVTRPPFRWFLLSKNPVLQSDFDCLEITDINGLIFKKIDDLYAIESRVVLEYILQLEYDVQDGDQKFLNQLVICQKLEKKIDRLKQELEKYRKGE